MSKQIKTSELTGAALDWAVAKCEGAVGQSDVIPWFKPSTDWSQGGPIIERAKIDTYTQYPCAGATLWYARQKGKIGGTGPTPLIAAMRCYVASKLGDTVEVPDELLS